MSECVDGNSGPPWFRYVLAHTFFVSQVIGVICAWIYLFSRLRSEGVLVPQIEVVIWIVLAAIPAAAIGWIIGFVLIWRQLLGQIAAWLQGWPFEIGDQVWILTGEHKNQVAMIYEVWTERGQVRVDLGPEAKKTCDDVYCATAVCRTRKSSRHNMVDEEPTRQEGLR